MRPNVNETELSRREVLCAGGVAACFALVAGLLGMAKQARAQPGAGGEMLRMYFRHLRCDEETDEVGADEPYVLVTVVNLASSVKVGGFPVPLPAFEVARFGPFDDVDKGETHAGPGVSQSFWGVNGSPAPLSDPDQVIIVVALMENDDGNPENLRGITKGIVGGSVLATLSLSRADKVAALLRDVNSALGTPTGAPNFDDKIGDPQELRFSREELARASSGQTVGKDLTFQGDGGRYTLTFEVKKPALVAANPSDKWVLTRDNRILVVVNDGRVFGHDLVDNVIEPAFRLSGPPVAANPQDKRVVTMGNRILVIVNDGRVFAHDLDGNTIKPAFQLTGPPVAANPQDKRVVTMGNRILVIVNDGRVFAHDLDGNTIKPAFQLTGPPVAANPQDKWVVTRGNRILVIDIVGRVFAHDLDANTIKPAARLDAPLVASNPQDKWVVTMGNRILVIVNDGRVFAHDLDGNTIKPAFQLS